MHLSNRRDAARIVSFKLVEVSCVIVSGFVTAQMRCSLPQLPEHARTREYLGNGLEYNQETVTTRGAMVLHMVFSGGRVRGKWFPSGPGCATLYHSEKENAEVGSLVFRQVEGRW